MVSSLSFQVRSIRQTSSGGDHAVSYTAEVDLIDDARTVEVTMVSIDPPDAPAKLVDDAIEAVRCGAARALREVGKGARIAVHRFLIYSRDFVPYKIEFCTERAFVEALKRL